MPREKQNPTDAPRELAQRITEALLRERVVPRFVDSYVVENGRHALQVHASLYRDLLALLQREALLALTVRSLAIVCDEPQPAGKAKPPPRHTDAASPLKRRTIPSSTVAPFCWIRRSWRRRGWRRAAR